MRHDPAWLTLHDGHTHGVLADGPAHAHHRIAHGAGRSGHKNQCHQQPDTARNHLNRASSGTSGSAAPTHQNHPTAYLPIDERVWPAGSCTGGFRTQAPETLHNCRRSWSRQSTAGLEKACRSGRPSAIGPLGPREWQRCCGELPVRNFWRTGLFCLSFTSPRCRSGMTCLLWCPVSPPWMPPGEQPGATVAQSNTYWEHPFGYSTFNQ